MRYQLGVDALRRHVWHLQVCPISFPGRFPGTRAQLALKCFLRGLALAARLEQKPFAPTTRLWGKLSWIYLSSYTKSLQSLCHTPL